MTKFDLPRVKVLFVMAHGASGTTLFGNILNEVPGLFHTGELRTLWSQGLRGLQECGCGLAVPRCPVWSQVLDSGFGPHSDSPLDAEVFDGWHRETTRGRRVPRLLRLRPGRPTGWPILDRYVEVADRLYRAVAKTTGARVVVDTSKRAGDAALLHLLPGIDPYFVHLVRDPRAVLYSWRRRNRAARQLTTLGDWSMYAVLHEAVRVFHGRGRSMRIRFEDFLARPRQIVEGTLGLLGEPVGDLSFLSERSVELSSNHTIAGHWIRFYKERVELKTEEEWLLRQPRRERIAATAVTLPLLVRYGYPMRLSRKVLH
jgi:hypothetical protein